ncbi:MAG: murein hydrolase activator EnvC family protein [Bacilli bacterium]
MKTIFKATIIVSLLLFTSFNVYNKKLHASTLNSLYSQLNKLQQDVSSTNQNISSTKQSIENNKIAIENAGKDIENKQSEILDNQTEINDLETDKKIKFEEIKDLLVYYQTNNTLNSEISFVVDSTSLTDSIHRKSTVNTLTDKSNDKIDEFIGIQDDLTVKNQKLTTDISSLEKMQIEFEEKIKEFQITLTDLSGYKVTAADKVKDMKNTIAYYEGLGCKKTEDLEACKKRTNNIVPNASGFSSPLDNGYISSEFGWRWGSMHAGIDMYNSNRRIMAAANGIVGAVGYDNSRGNYVYIHHTINGSRYSTAYFHMSSSAYVNIGQQVNTNTQLGSMGNTGNSTGPHLHFEILVNWYGLTGYNSSLARNPRNYLSYPAIGVYWSGRNR